MAKKARVSVNPDFKIGDISKRIYGAFMEPIGTIVNGNMYNPKHPTADEQGFRKDWIEALKKTDLSAVRLPGGNFVSGWDWKDSIGRETKERNIWTLRGISIIPMTWATTSIFSGRKK